jgi:hypothetical protein
MYRLGLFLTFLIICITSISLEEDALGDEWEHNDSLISDQNLSTNVCTPNEPKGFIPSWIPDLFSIYFHPSALLPVDRSKKLFLENLAEPLKEEMTLFRFTKTDVAERQVRQGKFSKEDIEFYQGSQIAPGQVEHRRMGKGVYVVEPAKLDELCSFGEDRVLRNNPSLIKVTLPRGSRVLDLTDPQVRKKLREADITDADVAFVDPHVAVKFQENPGNKNFYVLKELEHSEISPVRKSDFEKIPPARLSTMFSKMSALGKTTIRNFLPDNLVTPQGPVLKEKVAYALSSIQRVGSRIAYGAEFKLRTLKTTLKTRQNIELRNPDKLFPNFQPKDLFVASELKSSAPDELYFRGSQSIIKIKDEDDVKAFLEDGRFDVLIYSEGILGKDSAIRRNGNLKKEDLFALITPMPLKKKIPSPVLWPPGQNPINAGMAKIAYDRYFSKPYVDQDSTISRRFGATQVSVARPNHSVLNAMREGFLSIDAVQLLSKYAPKTEIGKWVSEKLQHDPNFLKRIYFGGLFERAARRGERSESLPCSLLLRSAVLIWKESKGAFRGLFRDEAERASFARSFAYENDHDRVCAVTVGDRTMDEETILTLKEMGLSPETKLSDEEKFYQTLLSLGHDNDHRRMFAWKRELSFAGQDHFLATGGKIKDSELRKRIVNTLWTRSGYYLNSTGAGDVDQFLKLGLSDWRKTNGSIQHYGSRLGYWYRDIGNERTFFKLSNDPIAALKVLSSQQQTLSDELLPASFLDGPSQDAPGPP